MSPPAGLPSESGIGTAVGGPHGEQVSSQLLQPRDYYCSTHVLAYTVLVHPSLHEAKWSMGSHEQTTQVTFSLTFL